MAASIARRQIYQQHAISHAGRWRAIHRIAAAATKSQNTSFYIATLPRLLRMGLHFRSCTEAYTHTIAALRDGITCVRRVTALFKLKPQARYAMYAAKNRKRWRDAREQARRCSLVDRKSHGLAQAKIADALRPSNWLRRATECIEISIRRVEPASIPWSIYASCAH